MNITGKLEKKAFVAENGQNVEYYTVIYQLAANETVEVKMPKDKAKLLLISAQLSQGK